MSTFNLIIDNSLSDKQTAYEQFCSTLDLIYNLIEINQKQIKYITAFDYYFYNEYPNNRYSSFLNSLLVHNSANELIKKSSSDGSMNFLGENPKLYIMTVFQSTLAYAQKIIYREKAMISEEVKSRGELRIHIKIIKEATKRR